MVLLTLETASLVGDLGSSPSVLKEAVASSQKLLHVTSPSIL